MQISPAAQAIPQDPQFDVLVFVFTQTPEQHVSPAAQAFPQVPQLASSVCYFLLLIYEEYFLLLSGQSSSQNVLVFLAVLLLGLRCFVFRTEFLQAESTSVFSVRRRALEVPQRRSQSAHHGRCSRE